MDVRLQRLQLTFFIMLCSGLMVGYISIPEAYFKPLNELTAQLLGLAMKSLGIDTNVINNRVVTTEFSVRIIPECTPILCLLIYTAFIVSHQATIKSKIQWLFLGACTLVAVNLLRLIITLQVSRHNPDLFPIVHIYFSELMMSGCVITMCLGWMQYRGQILSKNSPALFILRLGLMLSLFFLPWLYLQRAYMQIVVEIVVFGFRMLGYKAGMNLRPGELVIAGFSIIFFSSLILATRSLKSKDRIYSLLIGIFTLSLTHIIINTCLLGNFLMPQPMWVIVLKAASITCYVLPILMWMIAVRIRS